MVIDGENMVIGGKICMSCYKIVVVLNNNYIILELNNEENEYSEFLRISVWVRYFRWFFEYIENVVIYIVIWGKYR